MGFVAATQVQLDMIAAIADGMQDVGEAQAVGGQSVGERLHQRRHAAFEALGAAVQLRHGERLEPPVHRLELDGRTIVMLREARQAQRGDQKLSLRRLAVRLVEPDEKHRHARRFLPHLHRGRHHPLARPAPVGIHLQRDQVRLPGPHGCAGVLLGSGRLRLPRPRRGHPLPSRLSDSSALERNRAGQHQRRGGKKAHSCASDLHRLCLS